MTVVRKLGATVHKECDTSVTKPAWRSLPTRPLVSVDCKDDPRSAVVDTLSTMVIDGTQVNVLAWYDNEWGYVNRMMDIAVMVAESL